MPMALSFIIKTFKLTNHIGYIEEQLRLNYKTEQTQLHCNLAFITGLKLWIEKILTN